MNGFPDKDIIEEVAVLMGIRPAFVEKDWYVTQIISRLASVAHRDFQLIFSGGTALSKAHRLLQRFSEDVDYRVVSPSLAAESPTRQRKLLSGFKATVIQCVDKFLKVDPKKVTARNGNRFFALELTYPTLFSKQEALRPHLKVEFTVADLILPASYHPVSSLFHDVAKREPEVGTIACLDPVENACDKISALVWRIPDRVRGENDDDPDIVRHIHDLAILSDRTLAHPSFESLLIKTLDADDYRSVTITGLSIREKFDIMLGILDSDQEYRSEYNRFVGGMSYAPDGTTLSFEDALGQIRKLIASINRLSH
ncbi:nucleotidyl transferase AbiEii/AbiGii toxin family protein [Parapedobacter tibetensis]|uniref:nucleotidyl transferase AbiEii/AbiGii toxin family protein n=1 Tax=Parapedobacter tibetensis TaxID=2972951 RepID=UPI00214D3FB9|nr:nucleotidyl transferase AbiEii/AbiGii toxin family protein [Parapedobacter tibetensis]